MTEHNKETAQAIIKLAYQQMQPMPHQQQMAPYPQQPQQPHPQQPAKPTLGQRAATVYRVGSAIEKGTARIRKDRSKMKAREHFGQVYRSSRKAGGGRFTSAAKAKFKSHMGYRGRQKGGVVTQALEGLSAGVDKGLAAAKDRTAEALRKHGNVASSLYVAGKAVEGMKKKRRLGSRIVDAAAKGYKRIARESARATKSRAEAKEQLAAGRAEGAKRPSLETTRDLMRTAKGGGKGSTTGNVVRHLGTEGLSSVMTPGGKRRSALQLGGRGLQAAGKGYAQSRDTADKIRSMIDG